MAVIEIRQYRIQEGKMAEWLNFMEGKILPFVVEKGLVPTALFQGEEDPSLFVWLRRFDSAEELATLSAKVYESDEWQTNFKPVIQNLIHPEQTIIHRVTPTSRSPMQ